MISSDHADDQGHNNGDHYKWSHSGGEVDPPGYHRHYHDDHSGEEHELGHDDDHHHKTALSGNKGKD